MNTLFSIVILMVYGFIASYASLFLLNIAGVPGALVAGMPEKRTKQQFIFGSIVSALGQSLVYLAYVAFIVNWTILIISNQGVSYIIWLFSYVAAILPLKSNLDIAKAEAKEMSYANTQTEALQITLILSMLGFIIFALSPQLMRILYNWVPYMGS